MRVMLQCLAQAACKPEGTREMMEAACTYKTCLEMQGAMMTYPSCANWLAEMWAGEELTMEDLGSVIRNKHGNCVCQELVRQASAEALGALFRKLTSKEHYLLRDLACHNSGCRMLQRVFMRDDLNDTIAVVVTSLMSVGWKHYLYHRFGNYVIQSILLSNSLDDHQRKNVMHQLLREIDMVELQRQWRDWKRSTLRGPELKRFHNAFLLIRKVCEGDRMMAESMVNLCYAWPEMHPAFIHTLTRP